MMNASLALAAALALTDPATASACDACDHHAAGGQPTSSPAAPDKAPATAPVKGAQVVTLTVTGDGFVPEEVKVKAGRPVTLVVTRTTDKTCATEIVMRDFGVNTPLPLGKAVQVTVTPRKPGTYRFACGMDMIAGVLKAE
jgi:plastocyanin domain-containing protein